MAGHRRQMQFRAVRPGLASPHASHSTRTAAPTSFIQDKEPAQGTQDYDQMQLDLQGSFSNFQFQASDYRTEANPSDLQPRSRETDLFATGKPNLEHHCEPASEDIVVGNVDAVLLHVPHVPHAPWSAFIAAQQPPTASASTLQQRQMNQSYRTPERQNYQPSDEGYFTHEQQSQLDSQSVRSNRSGSFGRRIQDLQSIPTVVPTPQQQMREVQEGFDPMDITPSLSRPTAVSDAGSVSGSVACGEEKCVWRGKTHSDLKKHKARHDAPHVCELPDCPRRGRGFATINDLLRHKQGVHAEATEGHRKYRCFAVGCSKPEKEWPRKDNFKSHLKKLHENQNVDALIKKSENWWDSVQRGKATPSSPMPSVHTSSPAGSNYPRQHQTPTTPYRSTASEAGGVQQWSQPRQSSFPIENVVMPPGLTFPDSLIPGTPQYALQRDLARRLQAEATGGLTNTQSAYLSSQPTASISQRGQYGQSMYRAGSNRPHQHRQSDSAVNQQAGQNMYSGHFDAPYTDPNFLQTFEGLAPHMDRSTSGAALPQNVVHQHDHMRRPRTVANPDLFCQQSRLADMAGMPLTLPFGVGASNACNDADFAQIGTQVGITLTTPDSHIPQEISDDGNPYETLSGDDVGQLLLGYERQAASGKINLTLEQIQEYETRLKSIKKSVTGGTPTESSSSTDTSADAYIRPFAKSDGKTAYRCKKCNDRVWERRSDIKKHAKRHTKPYGCTFEYCDKRFGAKGDWLRHETTKHVQQECWRCMCNRLAPAPSIKPCRKVFAKREQLVEHLLVAHKKTSQKEIERLIGQGHINSNFQPQFWCGFCQEVKTLKVKGKLGIHERYTHIAAHFTNEDKCIDEWVPPEGSMTKGEFRAKQQQKAISNPETGREREAEDDEAEQSSPSDTSHEEEQPRHDSHPPSPPQPEKPPEMTPQRRRRRQQHLSADMGGGRKRSASDAGLEASQQPAQRLHRAEYWTCCYCLSTNAVATAPICTNPDCREHRRCNMCTYFLARHRGDE